MVLLLIRTVFSKTRMNILPGLPGSGSVPVYACCHGKIISNAPFHSQKDPA